MWFQNLGLSFEQKRNVMVKISGTFLLMLGTYMVVPFLAVYLTRTSGVNPAVIGTVLAFNPIGSLLGSTFGGQLSDRWGRKKIMILGLAGMGGAISMFPLASTLPTFACLILLQGFFYRLTTPAANTMLAESIPVEHRPRVYALDRVAFNAGGALGPVFGSFLLVRYPTLMFELVALLIVLYMLTTWLWIEDIGFAEIKSSGKVVPGARGFSTVLQDRDFLMFVAAGTCMAATYFVLETMLPVYLVQQFPDNGLRFYTLLIVTNAVAVLLLQMTVTNKSRGLGTGKSLLIGSALYAVSMFAAAAWANQIWIYLCFLVFVLGELLISPYLVATVAKLSPLELRGRYMAFNGYQWTIGSLAASTLGGMALKFGSGALMLSLFGVLALCACALYFLFAKRAQERLRV